MATARILIVDDEPMLLNAYTKTLTRHGFDVRSAIGPGQALEIVRSRQPPIDALVSDVSMPEMRGTDLVREIMRESPETACLLMTGGIVDSSEVPSNVPLLRKPLLGRNLISAIERALERSEVRARREAIQRRSFELRRQSDQLRSACCDLRRQSEQLISESYDLTQSVAKTVQRSLALIDTL